eukprot:4262133-Pyramimonas_sp.AAC.1
MHRPVITIVGLLPFRHRKRTRDMEWRSSPSSQLSRTLQTAVNRAANGGSPPIFARATHFQEPSIRAEEFPDTPVGVSLAYCGEDAKQINLFRILAADTHEEDIFQGISSRMEAISSQVGSP